MNMITYVYIYIYMCTFVMYKLDLPRVGLNLRISPVPRSPPGTSSSSRASNVAVPEPLACTYWAVDPGPGDFVLFSWCAFLVAVVFCGF